MSDKRTIRHSIKHIQAVKTWQLLILLVLALFISATFLRLNNTGMLARRAAVVNADKNGNADEMMARLADLQSFTTSHMNADTGVFDLQEQYNRDVKAVIASASGNTDGYDSPQARADAICNPNLQTRGYSKAYQDCMLRELSREGQVIDPAKIVLPSPLLYRYTFASPLWSPDFAGWSVLVALLLALAIVLRLAVLVLLRLMLRHHYKRV